MSLLNQVIVSWEGREAATVREAEEHIEKLQTLISNLKEFNKLHEELQLADSCSKLEVLVLPNALETTAHASTSMLDQLPDYNIRLF
jgi:hypothetical protein